MKFKLVGGNLALDFVNTVGDHLGDKQKEYLNEFEDLASWSIAAEITGEDEAKQLRKHAESNPGQAKKVLKKAIRLRETLFAMLAAKAVGKNYPEKLLVEFNDFLAEALKNLRLVPTDQKLEWNWGDGKNNPERIIWSVTWSAANLFINDDLKFLKICADNICGWVFLDTSKNKKRVWCDMKDCGNRSKLRRYYSRNKSEDK